MSNSLRIQNTLTPSCHSKLQFLTDIKEAKKTSSAGRHHKFWLISPEGCFDSYPFGWVDSPATSAQFISSTSFSGTLSYPYARNVYKHFGEIQIQIYCKRINQTARQDPHSTKAPFCSTQSATFALSWPTLIIIRSSGRVNPYPYTIPHTL